MKKNQLGFTLIELILIVAIVSILLGFVTFNLVGEQKTVSVNSISDVLVSDLASQQNKAMLGQGSTSSFGIYFQSNKYTLFAGSSYSSGNSTNFVINLDTGYTFINDNFTNGVLILNPITGEVNGYSVGNDSIGIKDSQGLKTKTIKVNRYGVVIQEN